MSIEINVVIDSINLLIIIVINCRRSTINININSTLNIEKSNVVMKFYGQNYTSTTICRSIKNRRSLLL